MDFTPDYPLDRLAPADYNPRRIDPDAFDRLCDSLQTFGVVKPVIINRDGTLVAGHQRTRAMHQIGMTQTPAIRLREQAPRHDEIRFNLLHNAVETSRSTVTIGGHPEPGQYGTVTDTDLDTVDLSNRAGSIVNEISRMIVRYGPWGSAVVDPAGTVIANAEYLAAARATRTPAVVYTAPADQVEAIRQALDGDYGEYHYQALDVQPHHQFHCQMNRLRAKPGVDRSRNLHSSLYENFVLPDLQPDDRLVDFGAGHADYVKRLQADGYQAHAYEPYPQPKGRRGIDRAKVIGYVRSLTRDVQANGLYPKVVCDSVLNSVTSLEYEAHVLNVVNALTLPEGTAYISTRRLEFAVERSEFSHLRSATGRAVEFLDADNFSAVYRNGLWTMQHFHSREGLYELLARYYRNVTIHRVRPSAYQAVCTEPIPLDPDTVAASLDAEFNIPYPGGWHHHQHRPLVAAILDRYRTAHSL